jgi:hypothetical protein
METRHRAFWWWVAGAGSEPSVSNPLRSQPRRLPECSAQQPAHVLRARARWKGQLSDCPSGSNSLPLGEGGLLSLAARGDGQR